MLQKITNCNIEASSLLFCADREAAEQKDLDAAEFVKQRAKNLTNGFFMDVLQPWTREPQVIPPNLSAF